MYNKINVIDNFVLTCSGRTHDIYLRIKSTASSYFMPASIKAIATRTGALYIKR